MAKSTLKLIGAYEAWGKNVRQGRLVRATGAEVSVLIRVNEELPATPELLARLREDARLLGRLQHESVLRIEHISAVAGKVGEIYEGFECASAARILRVLRARNQVLPARAAVETAAAVGLALDEALRIVDGDRAVVHPGPGPDLVLVDTAGRIKLAGFRVARAGDPALPSLKGYGAPEGGILAPAATYLVGALLVELLSGEPPPEGSSDPERHEAAIRRALIRVLARPGDTPGDPVVQVVRQALAHAPTIRGGPGALGRKLRELAVAIASPGLRAWAPGSIPSIQRFSTTPELQRSAGSALPLPAEETPRAPVAPNGGPVPLPTTGGPLRSNQTIAPPDPFPFDATVKSRGLAPTANPPSAGPPLPDAPSRAFHRGATIVPDDDDFPEPTPIGASIPSSDPLPAKSGGPPGRVVASNASASAPAPTPPPKLNAPIAPSAPIDTTRPSPPRSDAGPSVASSAESRNLDQGPRPTSARGEGPGVVSTRRTTTVSGSAPELELAGEADDSEATVVGIERPRGPLVREDPLGPQPLSNNQPQVSRSSISVLDEEEPTSSSSGGMRMLVTAVFAALGLLLLGGVVLGVSWFALREDVPEETLAPAPNPAVAPVEDPAVPPAVENPVVAPVAEAPAPTPPVAPVPASAPPEPAPAPTPTTVAPRAPSRPPSTPPRASTSSASTTTPRATEPATEGDGPVRIRPPEAAATPAPEAPAPAATEPPPPAPAEPAVTAYYRVEFTSGDPSVTAVEVKCSAGIVIGSPSVILEGVPKGNCRVTGRGGDTPLITMVTVVSDRSYTCFSGRAPSCK